MPRGSPPVPAAFTLGIGNYGTTSDTRLPTGSGVRSNNGAKAAPALSGDILGNWRARQVAPPLTSC
jgi:hypothetical protein